MKKHKFANFYTNNKIEFINGKYCILPNRKKTLYAYGNYSTKLTMENLPNYFIEGNIFNHNGLLSLKNVKDLIYNPSYDNESNIFSNDTLYISYSLIIEPDKHKNNDTTKNKYMNYDVILKGNDIVLFIDNVNKYSNIDISKIKEQIIDKKEWYNNNTNLI